MALDPVTDTTMIKETNVVSGYTQLTVLVNDDVSSENYIDLELKGIYSCNSRTDGVFLMSLLSPMVHCLWYIKG